MRRTTLKREIRSVVSVLRSHATQPFDRGKTKSANFTKNGNCFEECNVLGNGKCELSPIELRCKFLARKSAKLIANFSTTMVMSRPSLSLSLSLSLCISLSPSPPLSLSLSHLTHLTHNNIIESACYII